MNNLIDFSVETINCNVLLIGKTGTGKSSFANYLFGVDKFTTGKGAPVTQWEENFQQFSLNVSDVQVNVYDSVGLEQNTFDEWMRKLEGFLSARQVTKNNFQPIPDIFFKQKNVLSANEIMHVIFYVVNGAGARIEPNELETLKKIYSEYKIPTAIIITNCDVATEKQMSEIESEIEKKSFEHIRVCSIPSVKTRGGTKGGQFGKDPALQKILAASYEKVGKELTIGVYNRLISFIRDVQNTLKTKIDNSDISIFKIDDIDSSFDRITGDIDNIFDKMNDRSEFLPPAYISYYNFVKNFAVEYQGRNVFEESFDEISDFVDNFDIDNLSLGKKINKATEDFEDGNVFEKIGAAFTMAGTALFLKTNIKKAIDEAFGEIISKFHAQLWKIERS